MAFLVEMPFRPVCQGICACNIAGLAWLFSASLVASSPEQNLHLVMEL